MCNTEYIRRVIGVTRTFHWEITTGGVEIDLAGRDLRLVIVAAKGGEQVMNYTTDANVLTFVWQGTEQTRIDKYSVILWENYGEEDQRRVDIHNFVELVPWTAEQGGEYPDLKEETIELGTSDFTDRDNPYIVVVNSLTSHSTEAALSANMGRVLNENKQEKLTHYEEQGNIAAIQSGSASIIATGQQDNGAIIVQADHIDLMDIDNTRRIGMSATDNGVSVNTPEGEKLTYNGEEVATVPQLAGKQDTLVVGGNMDLLPTQDSPRPVSSGGVYEELAAKLSDAPSDGKIYGRKDGAWTEVTSGGGGGGLTIVPVASGTTAITAEAGMYYRLPDNEYISELAITLPTIASTETMVQDIKFSFTTSNTPNVVFGTTDANAQIKYYDGFAITGNNAFEVKCSYNGTAWIISEIKKSGGAGPAGYGEEVTVSLTEKNGDVITPLTGSMEVTVIIDGQSTVYTSDPNGLVVFRVPYGLTYTVTAGRRDGWYISQNAYTLTYTAGQTTRSIVFQYRSYNAGLFITTAEGDDYTLEEWQAAVAAGTKTNADALYIHVITADLIGSGGTFLVGIDMIRERTFSTYKWNTQQSQFNTIPLNGNSPNLPYYYDGYGQTIAIKEEAQTRILEVPAFDYVTSLSITVDNRICPAFIGSYGQWVIFWSCIAEVDDILLSVRPNGTYLLSTFTASKWTSSQTGAGQAYSVNGPFQNSSQSSVIILPNSWKASSYYVVPFFAF